MKEFEVPFIKFDSKWKIKFMPMVNNGVCLFRFLVKKDGAPNVVSVAILQYDSDQYGLQPFWEVGVYEEFADGSYGAIVIEAGEATSELSDTSSLLKNIEDFLYCAIPSFFSFEEEY